jgi:hypothetical protein
VNRGRLITAFAITIAALPATPAHGAGGTYDVVFCGDLNRVFGGEIQANAAFSARSFCNDAGHYNAVQIVNELPAHIGRSARAFWEVGDPLGIVGVSGETRLRRAGGYVAELYMSDQMGDNLRRVKLGGTEPTGFVPFSWQGDPFARFVTELRCDEAPTCPASAQAHAWVRDLRLTVADYADPTVDTGLSLYEDRWIKGESASSLQARDEGSGVSELFIDVNGTRVVDIRPPCPRRLDAMVASAFPPCGEYADTTSALATDQSPFVNGLNEVQSCSRDFAGNTTCHAHQVRVDNEVPAAAFIAQDEEDPELVRVGVNDPHSGLDVGAIFYRLQGASDWRPLFTQKVGNELHARVDSAAEAPGTYEFMATATDVAGNTAETVIREDGTPMVLDFPLRSAVELTAHIEPGGSEMTMVPYGRRARAEGVLLDAAGRPLANQPVTIDENFGEGALIEHRVRTVTTRDDGSWRHQLPAGPTRSVTATYAGDQRYLDDDVDAGRLIVETGADLALSRDRVLEGHATTFKGAIARLGARIPAGGKLVQLQYFDPGSSRWFTVRNPFRTESNGRFKFRYSFGTHYVTDVAIRFRLNVPAERGWPYRSTHTGPRRVIVEARQ